MNRRLLILSMILVAGCDFSQSASDGPVRARYNDTTLEIPRKYILPGLPLLTIGLGSGLDVDGRMIHVSIPLSDLGYHITNEEGFRRMVQLSIYATFDFSAFSEVNPDAIHAWEGTEIYTEQDTEYDDQVSLYRIYPNSPIWWHYFRIRPNGEALEPSDWVANCNFSFFVEETQENPDLSLATCSSYTQYRKVTAKITFSARYINTLDDLKGRIRAMMESWDVDNRPTRTATR